MTDDADVFDVYEMRITYALHPETGEPMIGFHEHGEQTTLVQKLGMLEFTKDTLLHDRYNSEEYND